MLAHFWFTVQVNCWSVARGRKKRRQTQHTSSSSLGRERKRVKEERERGSHRRCQMREREMEGSVLSSSSLVQKRKEVNGWVNKVHNTRYSSFVYIYVCQQYKKMLCKDAYHSDGEEWCGRVHMLLEPGRGGLFMFVCFVQGAIFALSSQQCAKVPCFTFSYRRKNVVCEKLKMHSLGTTGKQGCAPRTQ